MLCQNNTRMVHAVKEKHPAKFDVDLRPRDDHRDELEKHGISLRLEPVDQSGG